MALFVLSTGHGEESGEEQGADDGHGHGHGGAAEAGAPASFEEQAAAHCECGVPIYQCAECRYEVGMVKLEPGIMKGSDSGGLVGTQAVARGKLSVVLPRPWSCAPSRTGISPRNCAPFPA